MNEITKEMIGLATKGNQYAVEDLYKLTYSSVYKTAKVLIQDEDTVLDIVQDSYVKAFQSLDQLDSPENFRAWIKRIAANKAKDYLKKKKPILFSELANEDGDEIDFLDERLDHYPEMVIDRKETTRLMKEILEALSEDQRLVIGMFYYEQMSVKEIAETLGCSENTVKSRLNYGRKKVEVKVKDMEKKGTKLYSLAPLPFLLSLFALEASAAEVPSEAVLEAVTAKCAAGAAGAGAKAAAHSGAKALTTKIVAGVLAVAVAGGGTAAAISAGRKEEAEPVQQTLATEAAAETAMPAEVETAPPAATETAPAAAADEAYRSVTADYQAVIGADSAAFLNAPERYFNGDHAAVRYYHMYHGDNFYYAYRDIDGNGIDELLIGFGSEGYIRIVDLYGFDGEQAVQLIDEPTLGDRSSLSLLEDGTLYLFGGSSATEATHAFLRVDGYTLKEADASTAEEVTDLSWQMIEGQEETAAGASFDTILADIQTALTISTEDYGCRREHHKNMGECGRLLQVYRCDRSCRRLRQLQRILCGNERQFHIRRCCRCTLSESVPLQLLLCRGSDALKGCPPVPPHHKHCSRRSFLTGGCVFYLVPKLRTTGLAASNHIGIPESILNGRFAFGQRDHALVCNSFRWEKFPLIVNYNRSSFHLDWWQIVLWVIPIEIAVLVQDVWMGVPDAHGLFDFITTQHRE